MARKTYTAEFKFQALKMMADQGLSVAEVARRLGVRENLLRDHLSRSVRQYERARHDPELSASALCVPCSPPREDISVVGSLATAPSAETVV